MHAIRQPVLLRLRRTPLASLVTMLLGLSPAAGLAGTTWPISSCEDDGTPGTLREVIKAVTTVSGDSIDLGFCSGSTITLQTGAIEVKQDDLTLAGPGAATLQIDGAKLPYNAQGDYRIFTHTGSGTLTVQGLGLIHGHVYHAVDGLGSLGGCIYSSANVELKDVTVSKCSAYSAKSSARGGAVFAYGNVTVNGSTISASSVTSLNQYAAGGGVWSKQNVTLDHGQVSGNSAATFDNFVADGAGIFSGSGLSLAYSAVSGNTAYAATGYSFGGGADVRGGFTCGYSTIDANVASGSASYTLAGGAWVHGDATLKRCTISNNHSDGAVGGLQFAEPFVTHSVELRHSTISGNSAGTVVGGMASFFASTAIHNTTIAFNTAGVGSVPTPVFAYYGPGLALSSQFSAMSATLSSSLLSNNTYGAGVEVDLTAATTALHPITFNASPANNLIRSYLAKGLPDDTIAKSCPLLGPLRDNGGPTRTHALLSGSAAIDAGNNANGDDEDQRGVASDVKPFPYPRESGLFADIGAYEVDQAEILFDSGFEGCPSLN